MLSQSTANVGELDVERRFQAIREQTIGYDATLETPYGIKPLLYADWTASGRLYRDIESRMVEEIGPYVANTHSESSTTGRWMTRAYHYASAVIRQHVGANEDDVLLACGTGATGAINKLQRMLGLRLPERWQSVANIPETERPVVFVTHMEHHSNHISWLETVAEVIVVPPGEDGLVDPAHLEAELVRYEHRPVKIGSFTACSNVTGIRSPYPLLAEIMHRHGGVCFVDFAASAPYDPIVMHPSNGDQALDAIFFSPHKFLGGPGSAGVLVFRKDLYHNRVPDEPGGGTVDWTNPWGGRSYISEISVREDGGTPGFLQLIRAALAVQLKETMGVEAMHRRESVLTERLLTGLSALSGVHVLAGEQTDRLGIVSFYIEDLHYHLVVQLLNDLYGIQTRGGCSCAGTYGHFLLGIDADTSRSIVSKIGYGNLADKPGWVRMSLHPTMTLADIDTMIGAVRDIAGNGQHYARDYHHEVALATFTHRSMASASASPDEPWRHWFRK
ncbi:MAG: aminotransferase class V-fold PLP-dependent enzyme [Alicyclobacillaceae bacterium]|nr:aminotransferase class V-fold PLP-dependent enzyme [Alicyclobacillaceae bacterium]